MKNLWVCLFLLSLVFLSQTAFADMGDVQRVHSDIHAQVRNPPLNEGKSSSGPTAQRDVGHG